MIETIIVISIIFIILIIYSCNKIDITRYEIKDKKIDKNLKIMHLSDLHDRNITKRLEKIIQNENPDLIILSGDMINEYKGQQNNFYKLINILEKYETYYTYGNHEENMKKNIRTKYDEKINKSKINIINNTSTQISKNIDLYGLDLDITYFEGWRKKKLTKEYIQEKIGEMDENKYNILIAHNPLMAYAYKETNADLVLTGHVHGGIIIVPFIGGLLSPEYKFFPKYYDKIHKIKNMTMVVSRGLGFSARVPLRMFNPAEVVIINLTKK